MAQFVHDPTTMRFSQHASGGEGVSCNGPTVMVDGTLTFTDEQGDVIVSVPIRAERMLTAEPQYGASPLYSPITAFSTGLQEKVEYDIRQIVGRINWIDDERLVADFHYNGQTMLTETTGVGVFSLIAVFEADEVP
jgi:hypothetical protein